MTLRATSTRVGTSELSIQRDIGGLISDLRDESTAPSPMVHKPSLAVLGHGIEMPCSPKSTGYQKIWTVAYWTAFKQLSPYLPLASSISHAKGKRKNNVAGCIDLAMIFTSADSMNILVSSAGGVLSAVEKKKRCKSNQASKLELCVAKWARTILFYANISRPWSCRQACVFCWFTGKIPVPSMYSMLHYSATCLDVGRMFTPKTVGSSLEIKCFNSNPWWEWETLHVLILFGISLSTRMSIKQFPIASISFEIIKTTVIDLWAPLPDTIPKTIKYIATTLTQLSPDLFYIFFPHARHVWSCCKIVFIPFFYCSHRAQPISQPVPSCRVRQKCCRAPCASPVKASWCCLVSSWFGSVDMRALVAWEHAGWIWWAWGRAKRSSGKELSHGCYHLWVRFWHFRSPKIQSLSKCDQ